MLVTGEMKRILEANLQLNSKYSFQNWPKTAPLVVILAEIKTN